MRVLKYNESSFAPIDDSMLVDIDQSYNKEFNLNEGGWIRNDVSAFELAQSESEKLLYLDRLEEIKQDDRYKGLGDEVKIRLAMPRRALSDPVEYAYYQDMVSKVIYDEQKKAYDKEEEERLAKEEEERLVKEKESLSNQVDAVVQSSVSTSADA